LSNFKTRFGQLYISYPAKVFLFSNPGLIMF